MEAAGGRLGRSSSRFAPAASAFTGPVRRWTKRWVPLPNSSSNPSNKSKTTTINTEESSHLILFKWTPTSSSSSQTDASDPPPPKRKFRYVPVSVTGHQKRVAAENSDSEARASNGMPDADDVFMEEAQADDNDTEPAEEANQSKLDLNLS